MNIRGFFKRTALHSLKALGAFWVCRRITRHKLRILCYHGMSVGDQHEFEPTLFMRPEVFRRHMAILRKLNARVVNLSQGIKLLRDGAVERGEVVITIDDGWKSTLTLGVPILQEFCFPSCLYVATYYCERPADVFNMAVRYLLWKTPLDETVLNGLHPALDGAYRIKGNRQDVGTRWIAAAERHFSWQQRQDLLPGLCRALRLDDKVEFREGRFRFLSEEDLQRCADFNVDIQLHTHRHRLSPTSPDEARREIEENRVVLERAKGAACTHLCYPSGLYVERHATWLARMDVESATTCDPGLNSTATSPFFLRRYLDRDDASDIEFEAEICGVAEILRAVRARLTGDTEVDRRETDVG